MLKSYELSAMANLRHSSMDNRNLVITSLAMVSENSSSPYPSSNGKNKIVTGLASKYGKKKFNYFSNSPEVTGISLRSYYSHKNREILPSYKKHPSYKNSPVKDDSIKEIKHLGLANEFLIVKQSKIALYEAYNKKKKKKKKKNLRNMYLSFSKSPFRKEKKIKKAKLEKISFKEATRDKEWLSEAKPKILKSLNKEINKSNGIEINPTFDVYLTYKYYLGPGNNSKLIKQCLSQRWWWVRVQSQELLSANLVWTQWREQKLLDILPSLNRSQLQKEDTLPFSIINQTTYTMFSQTGTTRKKIVDMSPIGYDKITLSSSFTHMVSQNGYNSQSMQIHNKIDYNFLLSNKKALFYNLKQYYKAIGVDPFEIMPLTFHVINEKDPEFFNFCDTFEKFKANGNSLWILKPGENTNRGNGILVLNKMEDIKAQISKNCSQGNPHTFILQKYMENPFLINKRKFDIRIYALVTSINGVLQCFYYEEGYLRTSSKKFTISDTSNLFIHLTNDAIQKKSENYGKFESGNKLVYSEFQKYLDSTYPGKKFNFFSEVIPKIKKIIKDTIQSVFLKIDPNKRAHSFEIFGYDFLIDENLKPWLIEVNTNPCLELSCSHLARLIPAMIENAFRLVLDPLFPEPHLGPRKSMNLTQNKFELIFHSYTDGICLIQELLEKNTLNLIQEIDPNILEIDTTEQEEHPDSDEDSTIT